MKALAVLLAIPVAFLTFVFWGGYVLSVMWAWFVTPLGVAPITTLHAAGLQCLLSTFMGSRGIPQKGEEDTSDAIAKMIIYPVLLPALGFAVGWAIKAMM